MENFNEIPTPVQQNPVENKSLENKPAEKTTKKRNFCGWFSFFLTITGMILIISFVGSPLGVLFLALAIIFGII